MRRLGLALAGVLVAAGLARAEGDAASGRELYVNRCDLCHGSRGQGWDWSAKMAAPPVPVPDLAVSVRERSAQYLFEIIRDGGEGVGRSRFMPAFGFQLSDREVWDLVAYVRSFGGR